MHESITFSHAAVSRRPKRYRKHIPRPPFPPPLGKTIIMANVKQRLLASSILIAGLGLYSPLYERIYKLSVESFQKYVSNKTEKLAPRRKPCYKSNIHFTSSQIGIAISPDGTQIYRLTDNGIKVTDRKTDRQRNFRLPHNFPALSWGTDIAYDSKRDLVSLVSFGGEGYLYRFDVKERRWLDVRSLEGIDIKSIAYDQNLDRYVAWVEDYGMNRGNLLFIAGTGEMLYQESISDRMIGFYDLYDREYEMSPVVEIFPRGNTIALIAHNKNSVQSIWYYDLNSKMIRSTYKAPNKSKLYSD